MNIDRGDTPLVLLCSAWKTWGTINTVKPNTIILQTPEYNGKRRRLKAVRS